MIEFLYDGTIIHTKIYYTLKQGKRCYSERKPASAELSNHKTWFEFDAYLVAPLFLLPQTWQRYGYTEEDVVATYEKMDASFIWQTALMFMYGICEPENASANVKYTFQSMFTFVFSSRKNIFDLFMDNQKYAIKAHGPSMLCQARPDHKPLLPQIAVPSSVFQKAKAAVPPQPPSFRCTPIYAALVPYKDVFFLPHSWDAANKLVYMVRVIPKAVYDARPTKPEPCVITMPVFLEVKQVGGILPNAEYIMLHEACFFYDENKAPLPAAAPTAPAPKGKITATYKKRKWAANQGKKTRQADSGDASSSEKTQRL
jgi:hypothetical protein